MKGVKKTKVECVFCKARTIFVTESTIERGSKIHKRLRVKGGFFLVSSYTNRLPICLDCWARVSDQLEKPNPLRALLI